MCPHCSCCEAVSSAPPSSLHSSLIVLLCAWWGRQLPGRRLISWSVGLRTTWVCRGILYCDPTQASKTLQGLLPIIASAGVRARTSLWNSVCRFSRTVFFSESTESCRNSAFKLHLSAACVSSCSVQQHSLAEWNIILTLTNKINSLRCFVSQTGYLSFWK